MKKILKSFIFVALLVTTIVVKSGTNAEENSRKLNCVYAGLNEKIEIVFDAQNADLVFYYLADVKKYGTDTSYEMSTPYDGMGANLSFSISSGCPAKMKIYKKSNGDRIVTTVNEDKPDGATLLEELSFVSLRSGTYDAFNSYVLNSNTVNGRAQAEIVKASNHECSYDVKDVGIVTLQINMRGKIAFTESSYVLTNKAKEALYDSLTEDLRCPPTICINKDVGDDKVSLYRDPSHTCDTSGLDDGYTNGSSSRTEMANTKIEYYPAEDLDLLDAANEAAIKAGDCFLELDGSAKKCESEGQAYKTAAYYISATREKKYNPYEEMEVEYKAYEVCIKAKYTETEISSCAVEIAEYTEAEAAVVETSNPYIDSSLGRGHQFGSGYSLSEFTCEEILGSSLIELINNFFDLIKIIGVVAVIVLSMLDFVKAIMSSDADALKKAFNKLKVRLIVIVILLLLPVIIEYILETFEVTEATNPLCN